MNEWIPTTGQQQLRQCFETMINDFIWKKNSLNDVWSNFIEALDWIPFFIVENRFFFARSLVNKHFFTTTAWEVMLSYLFFTTGSCICSLRKRIAVNLANSFRMLLVSLNKFVKILERQVVSEKMTNTLLRYWGILSLFLIEVNQEEAFTTSSYIDQE